MTLTFKLSDGKDIPFLAWGSGTGGIGKELQLAIGAGIHALKSGIRHIDTAQGYDTEEATGESFRASGLKREDVWITTKSEFLGRTRRDLTDYICTSFRQAPDR